MHVLFVLEIVSLCINPFVADVTFEARRSSIAVHSRCVLSQRGLARESLCAESATERLYVEMDDLDMSMQIAFVCKLLPTPPALKRFLAIVHPLVFLQDPFVEESLGTQLALETPFLLVHIPSVPIQPALSSIADIFGQTLRALVGLHNAMRSVHVRSPFEVALE